jgi:phosphonate transport system permease protein
VAADGPINIATLGTLMGTILAVPVAYCAARNTTPSVAFIRPAALFVIVSSRSINSLIWALMLVPIIGPGAYGIMPQVLPAFAGISVFRWDINIRESTVLGLVGAGGIGLPLNAAITMLAWTQVSLILLIIVATVVVSAWVSAKMCATPSSDCKLRWRFRA